MNRRNRTRLLFMIFTALLLLIVSAASSAQDVCDNPANEIVAENCLTGNPPSEWDINGAGDANIQGFATELSVNQGEIVSFKIDTDSSDYRLDIYRLGYYNGDGARFIETVQPSATLPQTQPACLDKPTTGLLDCGNWGISASWTVPVDAVSGIYIAKLVREDATNGTSHIVFIVRDDDGNSDILFQTADTTWQAYNQYGGNSLYVGGPGTNPGRAYEVSYNRPFTTRSTEAQDWLFNSEYPMLRWLEANGYDVSYFTGIDSDRFGAEILEHKVFMSVGHDEYWSAQQRTNVEAARAAGVHLAFFSGNEIFWKTRWAESIDGSNTPYRTLVTYKETHNGAKIDPLPDVWTGTWRDPRSFNPEGPQPENALTGTIFTVNCCTYSMTVPAEDGQMRFWRNTDIATLQPGQSATLPNGVLGYEWDESLDNGYRPAGTFHLSTTVQAVPEIIQDYGSTYGPGTAIHRLTMYRDQISGALVFGAGTIQWSWGLDDTHDRGGTPTDIRMQQATVNLLADMDVQPANLQPGLVAATASTDTTAPTSAITSPLNNDSLPGNPLTITGTAADTGGAVGGIEVSTDGGASWWRATGRETWSYDWTPPGVGTYTLLSRAVDDSGNIETSPASITVDIGQVTCPCSIWNLTSNVGAQEIDPSAVELGVKFQASEAGYITAIRFYKHVQNTGTHTGRLWDTAGNVLATVTFAGETASGWQEALFNPPVQIDANTTYIASYHTPTGYYAASGGYFTTQGFDGGILRALQDGEDGANGVYKYGGGGVFPDESFNSANYWVDVVFNQTIGPDTTPPSIVQTNPANGAGNVGIGSSVIVTFNEPMLDSTINDASFILRDSTDTPVPASVSYDDASRTATLTPLFPLSFSSNYTVLVTTGMQDASGNALASASSWTFTTASPPVTEGPGGPILVISSAANPFGRYFAEILRTEGLNAFSAMDISLVDANVLQNYDVVVLGEMTLTTAQVTLLTDWVTNGGNLIAMRPDPQLAGLLGLTSAGGTISEGYLLVDTNSEPGAGIVGETIQFHGTADTYTLSGATALATLYTDATTPSAYPAVTINTVGVEGGQAAAFTFDLSRSIIYTRQGNPAWAGQERDGRPPIRSNDMFFGGTEPDWVDLSKVAIPQADEQQRLLANMITSMNLDNLPLPRFWYFPRDERAVVVMTGDDHGSGTVVGRLDRYIQLSPENCSVDDWECVRASAYIYLSSQIDDAQAAVYQAQGFEIGIHVNTNCEQDWTPTTLVDFYATQLASFSATFPSLPAQQTHRVHCIAWSDWSTQPQVELDNGIRLDTNYYYWPPEWVNNTPGLFTGSGMAMRFAEMDGTMIDVYQAVTQMTDESGQTYPFTAEVLLDRALGAEGYYGAFVTNHHYDNGGVLAPTSEGTIAAAQARGVPVISAQQLLTWLDGRNGSSFANLLWDTDQLSFEIVVGAGANGLRAMVPVQSAAGTLTELSFNGNPITYDVQVIKGVEYAFFDAQAGAYVANYAEDLTAPIVTDVDVQVQPDGTAIVTWTSDEAATTQVDYGTEANTLDQQASLGAALTTSHSITLGNLTSDTTYYLRVTSADTSGNSTTNPAVSVAPLQFTTPAPAACPCSIWDNTPDVGINPADGGAYELGVKFRSSRDGYISAIRFYKYAENTGEHVGRLWAIDGTLLAEATFTDETASGWQEVTFDEPVAITANTVYVASYSTTTGNYAFTANYFTSQGVDNNPLYALSAAEAPAPGTNGVFNAFTGAGTGPGFFPNTSFNDANYWVDAVFIDSLPGDTTPPTVENRTPAPGAVDVAVTDVVTVQFSEAIDEGTLSFILVDALSNPVAAQVSYDAGSSTATLDPDADLQEQTTYTVTVVGTVTDLAGNPLGADDVWTFTTEDIPYLTLVDTTVTDFGAGTVPTCMTITEDADGEVTLAPTLFENFDGDALPAGWTQGEWTAGSSVTVANGQVVVDGGHITTDATFGAYGVLEFEATYGNTAFQNVGFLNGITDDFGEPWITVGVGSVADGVYARHNPGTAGFQTLLGANLLGTAHVYTIAWTPTEFVFYVDGVQLTTIIRAENNPLNIAISEFNSGGGGLTVDWIRMTPYATPCTFTSRVLDAGERVEWGSVEWLSQLPQDTSLTLSVRTGDTPTPDGTWTAFAPVAASGDALNATSRYVQYEVTLATNDTSVTPVLEEVIFNAANPAQDIVLNGSASFEGRTDSSGDVRVRIYTAGTDTLLEEATVTVDAAGNFTLVLPSLTPGSYDIAVKKPGYLQQIVSGQALASGQNSFTLPEAPAGDLDGDNEVGFLDFSALILSYDLSEEDVFFEPLADFNADGTVNFLDFSGLASNFGLTGDEPAAP